MVDLFLLNADLSVDLHEKNCRYDELNWVPGCVSK